MQIVFIVGGAVIALVFAAGIAWFVEKLGKRVVTNPTNLNKD